MKRQAVPTDLLCLAALEAAFMGYAVWNEAYWWSALEENWFGWLTPAFSLFVLYDRRVQIVEAWKQCAQPGSRRATGLGGALLNSAGAGAFVLGLLAFLLGALHRAGAGPSMKGSTLAAAGVAAILLFLPWVAAPHPQRTAPGSPAEDPRRRLCALLIFPAAVWLLSAPLLSLIEGPLSLYLLAPIVRFTAFAFQMLGCPILREGNVLIMPDHGRVGVEEACSGIRSLTACVFAGSFLGALGLRSLWKECVLVAAAALLALAMNLSRCLFLVVWAYRYGTHAIEGTLHDAAGYAVLICTSAGLLALVHAFNGRDDKSRSAEAMPQAAAKDHS